MKTNRIKTLLTAVLLSLCASVSAYDFTVDGLYYNIVSLEDLTCEITYGDKVDEYHGTYSGDIVIPETVTYNNKTLTVVKIGENAFYYCSELSSVIIPQTVTYIGSQAFIGCGAITSITIPNSVTFIGYKAFGNCISLNNIVFEDGDKTLEWDNNDHSLTIFYGCPIDSLYLGRNLKRTDEYYAYGLFQDSSVKKLIVGNTVTEIENISFYGCEKLTEISLGNSVTTIGRFAFSDCDNLTEISLPNSVTTIGEGAFSDCDNLTEISLPNSVTTIGEGAFYDCENLTKVSLGNSVTKIGDLAFKDCENLTEISLGKSVAEIGSGALTGCSNLTTIYSLNPTPPTFESDEFTNKQYINMNVYVAKGSLAAYQTADIWKNFWNLQEYSTDTGIGNITVDGVQENKIYDLQGRKQDAPQHGINIINGKKVLVK